MKNKWLPIFIGLLITVGILFLRSAANPVIESVLKRLDHIDYDIRLNLTKIEPYSGKVPIAVIDIDAKSIEAIGRWPWPRSKIAELIVRLKDQGVAVIGFDVVFSDKDINAAQAVIDMLKGEKYEDPQLFEYLNALRPLFDSDIVLSKTLTTGDVVLGLFFYNQIDQAQPNRGALPSPLLELEPSLADHYVVMGMNSYIGNLPKIHNPGQNAGFLTFVSGVDGVVRRVPILLRYEDGLYPSLSLEAVRLYLLEDNVKLQTVQINDDIVIDSLTLGDLRVPLEAEGRMLIPYRGPAKTFPTISIADLFDGKDFSDQLSGAIVFVGASAFTLNDLITTPLEKMSYPGVEVHANIAAAIIDQHFLHYPSWAIGFEAAAIIVFGVLLSIILPFVSSILLVLIVMLCMGAVIGFNTYMWMEYGIVLPEVLTEISILFIALFNLMYGFTVEGRQRRQIKTMFGQYVPSRYIDKIMDAHQDTSLQGESREMTVLFTDIRSFTSISEKLNDATKIKEFLSQLFTPLTEVIFDHDGTIDKYVGDMIIAFWGAPLEDEAHAEHALDAALSMLAKVDEMQSEFREIGIDEVKISCGLNTGVMNVGDMGSKYRRSYTVLGDAVNLGSRVESLTKYYGVACIVTDTLRVKADNYCYRHLDCVRVKGKEDGVDIYEPLGLKDDVTQGVLDVLERERQALEAYRAQDWTKALEQFNTLLETFPEKLFYQLYLDRIKEFQQSPPGEDWDGVYTWTRK